MIIGIDAHNYIWLFRYDYETVETEAANKVIEKLRHIISDGSFVGTKLAGGVDGSEKTYEVKFGDDFYYEDPIDGSIAKQQVLMSQCFGFFS